MANGHSERHVGDFDADDWAAYFAPIATAIDHFAHRRNLRVVPYDHNSFRWKLDFLHPLGGVGRIDVVGYSEDSVALRALVRRDDFLAGVRTINCLRERIVERSAAVVGPALNALLDLMLAGRYDGETIVSEGHRAVWSTFTAEEFERGATQGLQVAR